MATLRFAHGNQLRLTHVVFPGYVSQDGVTLRDFHFSVNVIRQLQQTIKCQMIQQMINILNNETLQNSAKISENEYNLLHNN